MSVENGFQEVIAQLWSKIGLGPPRFGKEKEIFLTIDGRSQRLKESADGMHLYVQGEIGRLSKNQRTRGEQVEKILILNLALMQRDGVCVCLQDVPSDAPVVVAQHLYPYASHNISWLVSMVEDVMARVERMVLDVFPDGREVGTAHVHAREEEDPFGSSLIFRP